MSIRSPLAASAFLCAALLTSPLPAGAQTPADPGPWNTFLRSLWLRTPPGPEGNEAYRKGDYARALEAYGRANDESPDPRFAFNAGNAMYRQGRYPEATAAWRFALQEAGKDTAFAARTHYNLGNAFARKAEGAGSPEAAKADLREALAHYRKSLLLRSENEDAKRNLEIVHAALQRLAEAQEPQQNPDDPPEPPEPGPQAKEALARALQLVSERRYAEARAVLEDILRRDSTAASYRAHLGRLDDVRKILEGGSPAPARPGDPRARPGSFPGAPAHGGRP